MTLSSVSNQRERDKFKEVGSQTTTAVSIFDSSGTQINIAKETGGNLASIKTNTDNLTSDPATESKQDDIIIEFGKKTDFPLQVPRGLVTGIVDVNKFGNAPNGVQTTATDVWSRSDSTTTQQIWVAPTQARVHAIVSSSTDDDGNPVGDGARTIRILGLRTWDSVETTEDIILNGTTPVNTDNSYVIIYRMRVLTAGTTSINVGTITATAAVNGTVTAVIVPNEGQTNMAIYGLPSTQTFYMTAVSASMNDASAKSRVDLELKVNESPNVSPLNVRFVSKNHFQMQNEGVSFIERHFNPYRPFPGPCIIKVQAVGSESDMDVYAGFDGYLVNN